MKAALTLAKTVTRVAISCAVIVASLTLAPAAANADYSEGGENYLLGGFYLEVEDFATALDGGGMDVTQWVYLKVSPTATGAIGCKLRIRPQYDLQTNSPEWYGPERTYTCDYPIHHRGELGLYIYDAGGTSAQAMRTRVCVDLAWKPNQFTATYCKVTQWHRVTDYPI